MQVRTVLIWSFLNGRHHPGLRGFEKTIEGAMPVVRALFPGINYFSMTGFYIVGQRFVLPALKRLFPDLLTVPEDQVPEDAMTEIPEFLPSQGYEWEDDPEWEVKFKALLEAPQAAPPPASSAPSSDSE